MKILLGSIALASLLLACESDANHTMHKDTRGNYSSTSQYNAMDRAAFDAAMESGLKDFDQNLASLKVEAERIGPDAVEEYTDALEDLMAQRREFEADFARSRAMLADEWRGHREDVAEKYVDLRESLDDTYEEVVEES